MGVLGSVSQPATPDVDLLKTKTQRTRRHAGAFIPLVRKRHKSIDAVDNILDYLVGGEAIVGKEFPNFGKVAAYLRVKIIRDHEQGASAERRSSR